MKEGEMNRETFVCPTHGRFKKFAYPKGCPCCLMDEEEVKHKALKEKLRGKKK